MKLKRTQEYLNSVTRNRGVLITVTILSIIALILRFKDLTFQSYWFDELYSIATAIPENTFQDILDGSFRSVHPPLFHSMLWGWFKLFGFTELSGRTFPALFGTLSVPVIYLLGKELFNKETGIYAATFAAFNIFLIQFSQEVRPYSLLLFLSLLSLFFYIKTLKTSNGLSLVSFILTTTALLYTHYYGFLIIAIELLFLGIHLSATKTNAARLLVFALISTIAFALALLPIAASIFADAERTVFWIPPPSPDFILSYFQVYFGHSSIAIILIVLLMIKGFTNGTEFQPGKSKTWGISFVVLWLLVVIIVPYLKSIISLPALLPRTTIIAVPGILYLASFGLSEINQKSTKFLIFVWLIIILIMNIFYEENYYGKIKKEEYRYIVTSVIEQYPEIPVYSKKNVETFNAYSKMLGFNPRVQTWSALQQHLKGGTIDDCFILVERHHNKIKEIIKKEKLLETYNYKLIKKVKRKGVDSLLLAVKSTPESFCGEKKRNREE